jgi:hypothetical protein
MPDLASVNQNTVGSTPDPGDTIAGDFNENDFMALEMQRAGVLQQDLNLQADDIRRSNSWLSDLQSALSDIDAQVPSDPSKDTGGTATIPADVAALMYEDPSVSQYLQATKQPDGSYAGYIVNADGTSPISWGQGGATKLSAWLKDKVSQYSNNTQMDMITLQGQLNNYNSQVEMITSTMQKFFDTKDKVIQNIH